MFHSRAFIIFWHFIFNFELEFCYTYTQHRRFWTLDIFFQMGRNMFHGVRYQWLTKAHNTKEIHKAEALLSNNY